MMKKFFLLAVICCCSFFVQAQEKIKITSSDYNNQEVTMADQFRSDGKIYVLTGIILIILGGIVTYLIIIDRKISGLEKQFPNHDT